MIPLMNTWDQPLVRLVKRVPYSRCVLILQSIGINFSLLTCVGVDFKNKDLVLNGQKVYGSVNPGRW